MSKITELTKQKKNKVRYNIFIDDDYYCSLNIEEITINGIVAGREIDLALLNEIVKSDNLKYAFNLAIKYISLKRRTIAETKKHLLNKDLEEFIVNQAVQKVEDYKYLNDDEYAKDFVSYKINEAKFGRMTVKYKLKEKGIKEDIIGKAILVYDNDIESEICLANFNKLSKRYENIEQLKAKQKIYRSLASRGFSYDVIKHALNHEEY